MVLKKVTNKFADKAPNRVNPNEVSNGNFPLPKEIFNGLPISHDSWVRTPNLELLTQELF